MSTLISVANMSKSYKDKKVVNDVSLSISSGQILGLVGPNGAGKPLACRQF